MNCCKLVNLLAVLSAGALHAESTCRGGSWLGKGSRAAGKSTEKCRYRNGS